MNFTIIGFKDYQLTFPRVKEAYENNAAPIAGLLQENNISDKEFSIYLRAFKHEKEIELWIKDASKEEFLLLKSYDVSQDSGLPGPKRKVGDKQVPEGFYHIDRFNPKSKYHLSLGINYPNTSDRILNPENPGSDIFIHGGCETVGCLPIRDLPMEELYVFCVEAVNGGQQLIQVTIFPWKFDDQNSEHLSIPYSDRQEHLSLWKDLRKAYDLFNKSKQIPQIEFFSNGSHHIYQTR